MNNKTSFFKSIWHWIKRVFSTISTLIDRLLYSKNYTLLVSLMIAILVFFSIQYSTNRASEISDSLRLDEVLVEVIYPQENYEISGIPVYVSAFVSGSMTDLIAFRAQSGQARAVIDLTDKGPGTYTVKYGRRGIPDSLFALFTPETTQVTIAEKQSKSFVLEADIINRHKLEKQYIVSEPIIANEIVEVNASAEKLAQISKVVASVDVSGKSQSFEVEAPILVYDQQGKVMDVNVSPVSVKVALTISSPSRQVPLIVTPIGEIANGKSIESVQMDKEVVTLYGPQEALNKISYVNVNINGHTLVQNATISYTLSLPPGINSMDVSTVNLEVKLANTETKMINNTPILLENNSNNLSVTAVDKTELATDVVLSGAKERIEAISAADVKVYLDMTGVADGSHKVKLRVVGPDPLVRYSLSNDEINVIVIKKGE